MTPIDLAEHRRIHAIVALEQACRARLVWKPCCAAANAPMERQLGIMRDMSEVLESRGRVGWSPVLDGIARHNGTYGI